MEWLIARRFSFISSCYRPQSLPWKPTSHVISIIQANQTETQTKLKRGIAHAFALHFL